MNLKFTKLHGAGNDFIFIDARGGLPRDIPQMARKLCDRHLGIGGDGLIFLYKNEKADVAMNYSNSDGSPTTCGNGIRTLGRFAELLGEWPADKPVLTVDTYGGLVKVERTNRPSYYTVNMGKPRFDATEIPYRGTGEVVNHKLEVAGQEFTFSAAGMGNPHCVIFVPDLNAIPLEKLGPLIEHHPLFPERVNASFVQILSRKSVKMKVWERGVGVTLACGTANCAILAIGARNGVLDREIQLQAPGGDFELRWDETSSDIFLTGPTEIAFNGEISV